MNDQPVTSAAPLFEVGERVLVDEGPRGLCEIKHIEPGMIPTVGEGLEESEEQGYWYEVAPESAPAEIYRAPEYNLEREKTAEALSEPVSASNGSAGPEPLPTVQERLRRAYSAAVEEGERTKVIEIAPGIYQGLAAKYRPLDSELRRKLNRKAERTGERGEEADLNFKATLLADACLEILMRPKPGAEYQPLNELVEEFKGMEAIRYDRNLAGLIGIDLPEGATQAQVARLVFTNPIIFEPHYMEFSLWSTAALPDDEEEDDGERPT